MIRNEQQFNFIAWLLVAINAIGLMLNHTVAVITICMGIGIPLGGAFLLFLSWAINYPRVTAWRTRIYAIGLIIYYAIISIIGNYIDPEFWFALVDLDDGVCTPGIFPLLNIILLTTILLTINPQTKTYEKQIH